MRVPVNVQNHLRENSAHSIVMIPVLVSLVPEMRDVLSLISVISKTMRVPDAFPNEDNRVSVRTGASSMTEEIMMLLQKITLASDLVDLNVVMTVRQDSDLVATSRMAIGLTRDILRNRQHGRATDMVPVLLQEHAMAISLIAESALLQD